MLDDDCRPTSDAELNEHAATCPHCASVCWPIHQASFGSPRGARSAGGPPATWRRGFWRKSRSKRCRWQAYRRKPTLRQPIAAASRQTWVAATMAAALLIGVGVLEWKPGPTKLLRLRSRSCRALMRGVWSSNSRLLTQPPGYRGLLVVQSVADVQSLTTSLISPQQRTLNGADDRRPQAVTHSMSAALNACAARFPAAKHRPGRPDGVLKKGTGTSR